MEFSAIERRFFRTFAVDQSGSMSVRVKVLGGLISMSPSMQPSLPEDRENGTFFSDRQLKFFPPRRLPRRRPRKEFGLHSSQVLSSFIIFNGRVHIGIRSPHLKILGSLLFLRKHYTRSTFTVRLEGNGRSGSRGQNRENVSVQFLRKAKQIKWEGLVPKTRAFPYKRAERNKKFKSFIAARSMLTLFSSLISCPKYADASWKEFHKIEVCRKFSTNSSPLLPGQFVQDRGCIPTFLPGPFASPGSVR